MGKNVFLSYRYSDAKLKGDLVARFQAKGGPIEATPVSLDELILREGPDRAEHQRKIEAEIDRLMDRCVGLIVVAGNDSHNSPWQMYEIGRATGHRKIPAIAVRHPEATGGLPNSARGLKLFDWDFHAIAAEVRSWR